MHQLRYTEEKQSDVKNTFKERHSISFIYFAIRTTQKIF